MTPRARCIVRHDFGTYVCSEGEAAVLREARLRVDGRFDRRYRSGREAAQLESEILKRETDKARTALLRRT